MNGSVAAAAADAARELMLEASNPGEDWEQIDGWPAYWISDQGRVWSDHTDQILKAYTNQSNRYLVVELYADGKSQQFLVHGLVADHFMRDRREGEELNHIDGDSTNNAVSNLEWVDASEHATEAHGGPGPEEPEDSIFSTSIEEAPF